MHKLVNAYISGISIGFVFLAGCKVDTNPTSVSRCCGETNRAEMIAAPWTGTFKLYKLPDALATWTTPTARQLLSIHLKSGDQLGFRISVNDVVAVAGTQNTALPPGNYEWVMQADTGQEDKIKTFALVLVIVLVTGTILAVTHSISSSGYAL